MSEVPGQQRNMFIVTDRGTLSSLGGAPWATTEYVHCNEYQQQCVHETVRAAVRGGYCARTQVHCTRMYGSACAEQCVHETVRAAVRGGYCARTQVQCARI